MDLEIIKKIIEKEGGKVIIVENGKPTLIISRLAIDTLEEKKDNNTSEEKKNPLKVEQKISTENSIQLPEKISSKDVLLSERSSKKEQLEVRQGEEISLDDLPL
ncbi:hypothetical protein J7K92_01845 [bacterium]|nr:hypothetical protein [bacterium]